MKGTEKLTQMLDAVHANKEDNLNHVCIQNNPVEQNLWVCSVAINSASPFGTLKNQPRP